MTVVLLNLMILHYKEDFLMWCNCNDERAIGLFNELDVLNKENNVMNLYTIRLYGQVIGYNN